MTSSAQLWRRNPPHWMVPWPLEQDTKGWQQCSLGTK